jgi:hypothetical protein
MMEFYLLMEIESGFWYVASLMIVGDALIRARTGSPAPEKSGCDV